MILWASARALSFGAEPWAGMLAGKEGSSRNATTPPRIGIIMNVKVYSRYDKGASRTPAPLGTQATSAATSSLRTPHARAGRMLHIHLPPGLTATCTGSHHLVFGERLCCPSGNSLLSSLYHEEGLLWGFLTG